MESMRDGQTNQVLLNRSTAWMWEDMMFKKNYKWLDLLFLCSTAEMGLNIMQNAAHQLTALTQVPCFKAWRDEEMLRSKTCSSF